MATCIAKVSRTLSPVGRKLESPKKVSTVCSMPTVPLSLPAFVLSSTSSKWISNRYCPKKGSTWVRSTMPGEAGMPANLPTCRNDARLLGKVTSKSGSTLASSSESQTRGNPLSSRGTWHTNSCLSEHGLSFQSASTAYISPQSSPAPWLSGWLLLQPVKAMSSPSRDSHSKVPSVSMSSYPIQALPAQTRLKFSSLCMNQFSSASLMVAKYPPLAWHAAWASV
mmetsp:Transcript_29340/g.69702  ORF Transcript_29340/g.69702 Transcript_29340/m.69702 type:complete len:224 (+) Transcript_29340:701-1372(+)